MHDLAKTDAQVQRTVLQRMRLSQRKRGMGDDGGRAVRAMTELLYEGYANVVAAMIFLILFTFIF